MIKAFFTFCGMFVRIMMYLVTAFLFLCMNTFTIPLTVLQWLVCKLVKLRTPRFTNYSLMVYPTWNREPHKSLWEDIQEIKRKEDAKMKPYRPIQALEEYFFGG